MAEFQKVMEQYDRMCNGSNNCYECPITKAHNKTFVNCIHFMRKRGKAAEEIIMKWAAENPIMTNGKKFEEVFGFNAATIFEVNRHSADWLEEEYSGTGE